MADSNKDAAVTFLKLAASGKVREAYSKFVGPGFRHHNPFFGRSFQKNRERKKMMAQSTPTGQVQYINPDALNKNPAFTNVVVVTGSVKTVYVGGQDAVDASGAIVGKGDFKAQTEQILNNIQVALAAGGARLEHVVKWNLYVEYSAKLWGG
jgi:enamine deaminase RidA (YjgF/YER057c/UK114 family)